MAYNNSVSISASDLTTATNNGYSIKNGVKAIPSTGGSVSSGSTISIAAIDPTKKIIKSAKINLYANAILTGSVIGVKNFAVSSNKSKATFIVETLPTNQFYGPIAVAMESLALPFDYTFPGSEIQALSDSHITLKADGVEINAQNNAIRYGQTLTATTPDEWDIESITFEGDGDEGQYAPLRFTVASDKKSATLVFNLPAGKTSPFDSFTAVSKAAVIPPDYVFKASEIQALADNNMTLKANGVEITSANNGIKYGDSLVATAPDDWEIQSIKFEGDNDEGQYSQLLFEVSEDKKSASVLFKLPAGKTSPFDSFEPRATQVVIVKGSNYIYQITQDKLTELNKVRFKTVDITSSNDAVYDFGQFILGIIELPFAIDPEYIGNPEPIKLANMDTLVSAPVIKTDLIRVDLGEIAVPAGNSAVEDFSNATALLHLPRSSPIALDLEYVIGQTIGIEYLVDVYSGRATINITSSKIGGDVINTSEVDLGVNIPYTTLINTKSVNNINISLGGENHVKTPFIEIVRSNSVLPDGFWTIPVTDEGILSGNSGYLEVQNVELKSSKAMRVEKNEIVSLLASGVIIK